MWSLYATGKVHRDDLPRHETLRPALSNPHAGSEEKALFMLANGFGGQLQRSAPLKAIVLPHVGQSAKTRTRRATATEALLALAPSTTSQLPHAGAEVLTTLAPIVRRVPAFHLDIAAGDAAVPSILADLLDSL